MSDAAEVKVSILMTTSNHGAYIARALDSTFLQRTALQFEVVAELVAHTPKAPGIDRGGVSPRRRVLGGSPWTA